MHDIIMNYISTDLISLIGCVLSIIYWMMIQRNKCNDTLREELTKIYNGYDIINHKEFILKDYSITNDEIARRENITLVVGSILVSSSFIILGNYVVNDLSNVHNSLFPATVSIVLYAVWLFVFQITTKKIDERSYERIRALEKIISDKINPNPNKYNKYDVFGIHSFLHTDLEDRSWMPIRRWFWGLILLLLSLCWYFA